MRYVCVVISFVLYFWAPPFSTADTLTLDSEVRFHSPTWQTSWLPDLLVLDPHKPLALWAVQLHTHKPYLQSAASQSCN